MHFDAPYTLPGVLARAANLFADAPALVMDGLVLTFRQLEQAAKAATRAFVDAGIQHGDRVAVWGPNSPEWIVAALGVAAAGGVLVPLNTRLKGIEAGYILRRSGARILVTVGEFLGTRYPELIAGESLPSLERIVLLAGTAAGCEPWPAFTAPDSRAARSAATVAAPAVAPDDLADIMFTSGTTGQPKGVMSAHEQNVRVYLVWSDMVICDRATATCS
jgi:acyl-CoA synthetase (AMP-forming)/AMP-acid ligase II